MIGGTSAEKTMLTVKLASTKYYDNLPTTGDETGRAFRDVELENKLLELANSIGLGAQFGGKYLGLTMFALFACRVTAPAARSVSVSAALPTVMSSARSIEKASGLNSSIRTRVN